MPPIRLPCLPIRLPACLPCPALPALPALERGASRHAQLGTRKSTSPAVTSASVATANFPAGASASDDRSNHWPVVWVGGRGALVLGLGIAAIYSWRKTKGEAERLVLQRRAMVIAANTTTHLDFQL